MVLKIVKKVALRYFGVWLRIVVRGVNRISNFMEVVIVVILLLSLLLSTRH